MRVWLLPLLELKLYFIFRTVKAPRIWAWGRYMIRFNYKFLTMGHWSCAWIRWGKLFGQDCIFSWNLVCVLLGHDEFLAWNSFSQPWFMHNDGFGLISLMVYLAKSSQLTCGSDLSSKIGLLGACIKSNLSYINEYEFRPQWVQTWLGLIKMLGSFSYKNEKNILLKLKEKFIH